MIDAYDTVEFIVVCHYADRRPVHTLERLQRLRILPPAIVYADPTILFGADGELRKACASAMQPANRARGILDGQHGQEIEGDDVKDFDRLVGACSGKATAVGAHVDRLDFAIVRPELLDKLYTAKVLLPKLDHAVDGARYEEVGVGRQSGKAQLLAMHE